MSYDRQCSSCGGFCGRGGCKRDNVKPEPNLALPEPKSVVWIRHENEWVGLAPKERLPIETPRPDARKPLSYMEACTFIALNIEGGAESLEMQSQLVDLIRAVERAHGIGEV